LILCLLLGRAALATDGVSEINHVCAVGPGCFAGDTAGYPVQITQPGSYRLTSNLAVPGGASGVQLHAAGIDLDLGGFEIAGPVVCNPTCPALGSGSGVEPGGSGGSRCAVSNGKIRGFARDGIELTSLGRVEDVTISEVARFGVFLLGGGFAARNLIFRTGSNGMRFESVGALSLYERNTITESGQASVRGGKPSGPNACSDQLCGTSGKRFFYLTPGEYIGQVADTACAAGFHMASIWEILDPSALEYDTSNGRGLGDSAEGPPAGMPGWIRTGSESLLIYPGQEALPGLANCAAWTSSFGIYFGSEVALTAYWNSSAPTTFEFWYPSTTACDATRPVWCVQD
jgi:hypothetical protein